MLKCYPNLYSLQMGHGFKGDKKMDMVAHQEVEIGRIKVQGQPRQKVRETPSQPIKAGCDSAHLSFQPQGKCN
jgi:hypothetical protein